MKHYINNADDLFSPHRRKYQICSDCIMDTSDPEIVFDENGVCNHCSSFRSLMNQINGVHLSVGEKLRRGKANSLEQLVDNIKQAGRNKPYDCIIGVSGGVDSSYVAWLVSDLGLRPLAVHLDNGWNSAQANRNIHKLLSKLRIDLYTHVINWEEFRDLQISFLKASTPDSEIPTDHAIVGILYETAKRFNISYLISGCNSSTESIMPRLWSQGHDDWTYIKSVHALFGTRKLTTYPHYTIPQLLNYQRIRGINRVEILSHIDYRKNEATSHLEENLKWEPYPSKHGESRYTKFYQDYILPKKFNANKTRAHLSNLIANEEIDRESALQELENSQPNPFELERNKRFALKKLELTEVEFEEIMKAPRKTIYDYPNASFSPFQQSLISLYDRMFS